MREVRNTKYEWAHGKAPRGKGCWWVGNHDGTWAVKTPPMTVTEAKRWANRKADEDGVGKHQTLYMMP